MCLFHENPMNKWMIWGTIILGNTHLLQMILFLAHFFLSNHGVDYGKRPDKTNTPKRLFSFFSLLPFLHRNGTTFPCNISMEFGGFDAFPKNKSWFSISVLNCLGWFSTEPMDSWEKGVCNFEHRGWQFCCFAPRKCFAVSAHNLIWDKDHLVQDLE